ncbi:hypothetical protein B5F40_03730 [Gordonibacter sp. An230]|uniref:hypothetical protein n=1 Tax=Gordonibacter sp. An230 TaxID=1965592 RepID=UPI000B5718CF|nr:hypothetical protein [Gordonibacter sp. An230]OUO91552.1 hypothetical protein B5F40_03730 [Gordonibacter sp. An230]
MIVKSWGYSMLFYAVLLLSLFFLVFLVSMAAGGGVPGTWWGFAVLALLVLASTFFARAVVDRAFLRHLEALAREYDEGCIPGRFLEGARAVKRRNGEARGVWGVWLFSRWGMALDDSGLEDEAREAVGAAVDAAGAFRDPSERAVAALVAYPAAAQVLGFGSAVGLLDRPWGEGSLREGRSVSEERLAAAERDRGLMLSVLEGDAPGAAEGWGAVRASARLPMRVRVNAALVESSALRSLGDRAGELRSLRFAAENGPFLKAGREARARLEGMAEQTARGGAS